MKRILLMAHLFLVVILQQPIFASQVERARIFAGQGKHITSVAGKTIIKNVYLSDEDQRIALNKAADEAEEKIGNARFAMNNAQSRFLAGEMTAEEFDEKIYEQSGIIARVEQDLKTFINETIARKKDSQVAQDYLTQVRRSWMAWSGYEVTDEQKKSREELDILIQQKAIVKKKYDVIHVEDSFRLSSEQKSLLEERYQAVMSRIDNEISQQQLAINNKWSLFKKALVAGAVAAATTVAGLLFTYKWFGAENK